MLVVPPIVDTNIPKRHIAHDSVKEAVGDICFLKRLRCNRGFLIKLLCDSGRNLVNLHAVHFRFLHGLRQHTNEVSNSAGRLQDISLTKCHLLHCLVDCGNDRRRRIESSQDRTLCTLVFIG